MASSKRQPSGISGKKSTKLTGSHVSKDNSRKQGSKPMAGSYGRTSPSQDQGHAHNELTAFGPSSSKMRVDQRNPYDPAWISQWAAHSATGPSSMPDYGAHEQNSLGYGNDLTSASAIPQISGGCHVSQSEAFEVPSYSTTANVAYRPGTMYHDPSTAVAGATFTKMGIDHEMPQGQKFEFPSTFLGDGYSNGLSSNMNSQACAAFAPSDFLSFDSIEAHPPMVPGNNDNGNSLSSTWDSLALNTISASQPLDWSPSDLTPSSSSIHSSNSFLGHQPDTPVSATMYDGIYTSGQDGPLDGPNGMVPPFNLGEAMVAQTSTGYLDTESTIRPGQNFHRTPLPMEMWVGQELATSAYGLPLYNGFDGSRRSSEGEPKSARDHAFYKASPKEDGLYHCPYSVTENCVHKAEKLKCNYDKHLDSHLKPYRCKSNGCVQIQFSSTACLLRHEREAHGMHGHGPKPHLCYFKDCDRAQEDNGFPRRWNLFDHMKRVHDFAGTEPSNKSNSPPPSSSSPEPHPSMADPPKKKRTPSPIQEGVAKRAKTAATGRSIEPSTGPNTANVRTAPAKPSYQSQSLDQIWYNHIAQVQARLQSLDPTDPRQWKQYQADTETLQTIGLSLQFQQAQLAH